MNNVNDKNSNPIKQPLAILGIGMVTSLGGYDATCAAMRARFNNHKVTDFRDNSRAPVIGSRAAVDPELYGDARLVEMMAAALRDDSLKLDSTEYPSIPLALCTPEMQTVGRPQDDEELLRRLYKKIGVQFEPASGALPYGHTSIIVALTIAHRYIYQYDVKKVLILSVDSLVNSDAILDMDSKGKLLTPRSGQGVIPGEAAVAMLVGPPQSGYASIEGFNLYGYVNPKYHGERKPPVTGDELAVAMYNACEKGHMKRSSIGLRIADINGLNTRFEESALAEAILFRGQTTPLPKLWTPAESVGEVGAAISFISIAWACHAMKKGYLPNPRVLIHATNEEDSLRGAAVLNFEGAKYVP